MNFSGNIAIVTGASTGVGEAIARELYDRGLTVVITARDSVAIEATARNMDPAGQRVLPMVADVRDHVSVKNLIDSVIERFGRIDYLVNNAGITGPHGVSICDYDVADWQEVIQTDLSGVFYGMKYAIPAMLKTGGGAVVNLSAVNGMVGIPGIAPYTCAKHGVVGLTQSVALEFAEKGVRVNALAPGYVDTARMKELPESIRQMMAESHPMKRMAKPEEVGKLAAFLLSDDASFITGGCYTVDGGYTAQ